MQLLSVVIPIYNEEENIPELICRLLALQSEAAHLQFEFIFIDDGSKDKSVELLRTYAINHINLKIIILSRNFGHQIAISAGIDNAKGDFIGIIDGDLQDPQSFLLQCAR